jgi:hypothetical protein
MCGVSLMCLLAHPQKLPELRISNAEPALRLQEGVHVNLSNATLRCLQDHLARLTSRPGLLRIEVRLQAE